MEVVVTDHHAPRADGALPDGADRASGALRLPVPGPVRDGRRVQARRRRCTRRSGTTQRPLRADLDLVALATIADIVPLVGENRTLVRSGLRALAATRQARAARADGGRRRRPGAGRRARRRLRAGAAAERRRAPVSRGRRRSSCCSPQTRARGADRSRARPRQPRAPGRRAAHPLRGRSADDGARRAPRVRARRGGLARGRDRDRRLAPGRAQRPAGRADRARRGQRQGLGAQRRGLRPARRPDRLRRSTCCATAGTARRPAWRSSAGASRSSRRRCALRRRSR